MSRRTPALLLCVLLTACGNEPAPRAVVVYTSVDQIFAEKIFEAFTRDTGIRVRPVYDTEETKALGLARRIVAERADPQADIFWNGEAMRTCMLAAEGLLEPYESPSAADIDAAWRDPGRRWTGFGARARVIVYHTERVADPPRSIEALAEPRFKGRVAMANPRFGTTAAHVAALYQLWGAEKCRDFFTRLKANDLVVVGGNSHVRDLVARGQADVGLTDTDDVWIGRDRGDPIRMVIAEPAVLIPNTAALIRGARHPAEARAFLDFLLHADRERMMAEGRARQMPVRASVPVPAGVSRASDVPGTPIDWSEAYDDAEPALKEVQSILGL
jgi:iron(III) transport system substrate-binding protein